MKGDVDDQVCNRLRGIGRPKISECICVTICLARWRFDCCSCRIILCDPQYLFFLVQSLSKTSKGHYISDTFIPQKDMHWCACLLIDVSSQFIKSAIFVPISAQPAAPAAHYLAAQATWCQFAATCNRFSPFSAHHMFPGIQPLPWQKTK